jgi:uridine kinase
VELPGGCLRQRKRVISELAALIVAVGLPHSIHPHPLRVAIDGVDASGKTTLADELVSPIEAHGRPVIRASVDGFHNPRMVRYHRGEDSPEGYYYESFDHAAILRALLIPLGPSGNRRYQRAVFDYRVDAPLIEPACEAPPNAILLFDGVFLLRPELISYWDYSIFVDVDFEVSVLRAVSRDVTQSGGRLNPKSVLAKYNQRYVSGQKIYFTEANPKENADVVLDNNDLENPQLIVS